MKLSMSRKGHKQETSWKTEPAPSSEIFINLVQNLKLLAVKCYSQTA